MTAIAKLCRCGVFACLFWNGLSAAAADAGPAQATSPRPPGEPIAQLALAKAAGRFHLVFRGQAKLSVPGEGAFVVAMQDAYFREAARMKLGGDAAKEFVFEADVAPGSYYLTVQPAAEEKEADYWPSERQQIHIDKDGRLYQMRDGWSKPGPFVVDRRMKGVTPADGAIAGARAPVVLKWPAVAGATHYRGYYHVGQRPATFDVDETQFSIVAGIPADEHCLWRLSAMDGAGRVLARGEGWLLGFGTAPPLADESKEWVAKAQAAAAEDRANARPDHPQLGIEPMGTQVAKDPAVRSGLFDTDADHTVRDAASGYIPGIMVSSVMPGSVAIEAGLIPDDVIIAVDGNRVPSESNLGDGEAFAQQISRLKPGTTVALTVRRFPRELTLNATFGPAGAVGAARPAPTTVATAPKVPVQVATPAPVGATPHAAMTGHPAEWKWTDIGAGKPLVTAFKVKANGEVPMFTAKDGLAGDFVTCVAELPKGGGMAFGTQQGLSIWDGAEIRSYTGPSPSLLTHTMIRGNSELPANTIQDLLCDSRGRLWVATMYGVCRIEPANGGRWRLLSNAERGPFSKRQNDRALDVQKMFEMADGTVVLGGRNSAVTLIDPKTDEPRLIHHDEEMNHWVTGIAEDAKQRLWISLYGVGVLWFDGTTIGPVTGAWINGPSARDLAIDGKGTVWMTDGGEWLGELHADGKAETVDASLLSGDHVQHLRVDRKGRLFAISQEGAMARVSDGAGGEVWQYTQYDDVPYMGAIVESADGNWWITGYGVRRRAELKLGAANPRARLLDGLKRQVAATYPKVAGLHPRLGVAANGVVVVVADRRLLRYDGKAWQDLAAKVGRVDVYQFFADVKGTIWVGTSGMGLIGIDKAGAIRRFNNEPNHAKSVIYCLAQTPDGTLYAGTQHGVYRLRGETWEQVESDLFQVGEMLVDRRGRVWLTEITYSKRYVYDGKFFREVKEQTAISDQPLAFGTLRIDDKGQVLMDVAANPTEKLPQRTFKWDATVEGKVGPPTEVK